MRFRAILAVAATVVGPHAHVFGSSLTSIGVLDPNQAYSEVRAVSSDGGYVVGASRISSGTNVPVVWSSLDGLVELPNPSGQNSLAHGVAVGIDPTNNLGNIIVSGLHEGNLAGRFYKAPLTNLTSGLWMDTAVTGGMGGNANFRQGTANNLRNQIGGDGRWYTAGRRQDTSRNARFRGDPNSGWDGTAISSVGSVSGYGVNVGRSQSSGTPSVSSAFFEGPGEAYGTAPGSTGVRADGIGISASFGKSASLDFDVQWICGQIQNYGDGTFFQAFRWKRGDASMTFLGALPGDTSSVAYTVADNGVTAGRSHNINTSVETAVVWDTSGTWDVTGTAQSVQTLLDSDGVDTSAWTRLVRVYAASDDGKVLAGFGIWADDGSTRGFVATKSSVAPVVVKITKVNVNGGTVTIDFTSSDTADTTSSFVVQSTSVLATTPPSSFSDVNPAANITGAASSFQATVSTSGSPQFYRVKRP